MKFDGETELPKFGVFRRRYQATMFFCSHTWRSVKGWQKVLALILQLGWLHGLIGSFVDMTAMCFLQEIKILPDPDSANYIVAGRTVPYSSFAGGRAVVVYISPMQKKDVLSRRGVHSSRRSGSV